MFTYVDLHQWKRRTLFEFFKSYDNPTWDLMSDVRITRFYERVKAGGHSFFLSFLFAGTKAGNSIPELRCRIDTDGRVREYHEVHPGSTILYDDGTYGFGYFDFLTDYLQFLTEGQSVFERQKESKGVDPKEDDLARIYFSPIPWVSFTGFRHPFRRGHISSVPMIVFGKHYEKEGERYMPVGLTLHHGLADGYHAGQFFAALQVLMDNPDFIPGQV